MRNIAAVIIFFLTLHISSANAAIIYPPVNAHDIFLTVGKKGEQISLSEFSRIKARDLELLQGRKMKFMEKLCFRASQKKLRSFIERDGTINNQGFVKLFADVNKERAAALTGFALGLFANVFGVLFAYMFKDPYRKKRIKWAWIGLAVLAVFVLIFALTFDYGR